MTTWDDLQSKLKEIRDALDAADDTSLGKIGMLLDKMTRCTDQAIAMAGNLQTLNRRD